jgi:hypothetical protein
VDSQGCTEALTFVIPQPEPISSQPEITGPLCSGDANGILHWNLSGGTPPYTLNDGPTWQNVSAGIYTAQVTDSLGCVEVVEAVVLDPPVLEASIDFTCTDTGINLTALASGGTPPLAFEWQDGTPGSAYSGELGETYIVTVTDANACQSQAEASCPVGVFEWDVTATIAPNPATSTFRLTGVTSPLFVRITDLSGRLILEQQYAPETYIDVSDWPCGTYVVAAGTQRPVRLLVGR